MDLSKYKDYCTVGDLLKFIQDNNIPLDSKILIQRIEDSYFEKGWHTMRKGGEHYHNALQWNKDIDDGKYLDKKQYQKMKEENLKKITPEDLERFKEEYYITWCPVKYNDDNNLYLDAHY